MSSGIFGTIRPARLRNVNIDSTVEVLYSYVPSYGETSTDFNGFKSLVASECVVPSTMDNDEGAIIDGLFKLRLPLEYFNKKGVYTIYIRPKECQTSIVDVSVLAAYPDVKGVVLNTSDANLTGLGDDYTGFRIEFEDGTTRLIKSCNKCEPVIVNTGDGYPKTTRYNLTDNSSSYVFCTVSPSSAPTFRPNAAPYIGEPGASIKLINTLFSPKMFQVEMVTHDMDTLSYMLEGDQANDRDNAIITTYNENHEIYNQSDYYVLKDKLGNPIYNVRRKRENIDTNQSYDNIFN